MDKQSFLRYLRLFSIVSLVVSTHFAFADDENGDFICQYPNAPVNQYLRLSLTSTGFHAQNEDFFNIAPEFFDLTWNDSLGDYEAHVVVDITNPPYAPGIPVDHVGNSIRWYNNGQSVWYQSIVISGTGKNPEDTNGFPVNDIGFQCAEPPDEDSLIQGDICIGNSSLLGHHMGAFSCELACQNAAYGDSTTTSDSGCSWHADGTTIPLGDCNLCAEGFGPGGSSNDWGVSFPPN